MCQVKVREGFKKPWKYLNLLNVSFGIDWLRTDDIRKLKKKQMHFCKKFAYF